MNYNTEPTETLISIMTSQEINASELFLKYYTNKVNFYSNELKSLKESKPFFFQKKKLEKYNNKVKEYENIIDQSYKNIELELDYIDKLQINYDEDLV